MVTLQTIAVTERVVQIGCGLEKERNQGCDFSSIHVVGATVM